MKQAVRHNPYDLPGRWMPANFHMHCSENSGCSSVPLRQGGQGYMGAGVDILAVTDHDAVTDLALMRRA